MLFAQDAVGLRLKMASVCGVEWRGYNGMGRDWNADRKVKYLSAWQS